LSLRSRARCWESADWLSPTIRSNSPTFLSPFDSWHRIINRWVLPIALRSALARRALASRVSSSRFSVRFPCLRLNAREDLVRPAAIGRACTRFRAGRVYYRTIIYWKICLFSNVNLPATICDRPEPYGDGEGETVVETRGPRSDTAGEPLYQPALIGTHCDRVSRILGRRGRAGDAGASSSGSDAPRMRETRPGGRPFETPGLRREPLVMLQHHGAPHSSPETSKGRHNGFLSTQVGITPGPRPGLCRRTKR